MKYEEYRRRVLEWLWHYTTLDTWFYTEKALKLQMENEISAEDSALAIIAGGV